MGTPRSRGKGSCTVGARGVQLCFRGASTRMSYSVCMVRRTALGMAVLGAVTASAAGCPGRTTTSLSSTAPDAGTESSAETDASSTEEGGVGSPVPDAAPPPIFPGTLAWASICCEDGYGAAVFNPLFGISPVTAATATTLFLPVTERVNYPRFSGDGAEIFYEDSTADGESAETLELRVASRDGSAVRTLSSCNLCSPIGSVAGARVAYLDYLPRSLRQRDARSKLRGSRWRSGERVAVGTAKLHVR